MRKIKKITAAALAVLLAVGALMFNVSAAETEEHTAIVSVEAFSIGNGYVIEPTEVTFTEGENVAAVVDRLFNEKNISYEATGTVEENFFLKSVSFKNSDKIPSYITDAVVGYDEETGEDILFSDYIEEGSADSLGMNDYCAYLSGWMYTVNVPTAESLYLGMSQATVNDGDVIRVQFSLDCGADIGIADLSSMPQWGYHSDFYPVADKTELTRAIATATAKEGTALYDALQDMKDVAANLPASQSEVDAALSEYNTLLNLKNTAIVSVEAFSIGNGYVIEPTMVTFTEGESVAAVVDRLFKEKNISYEATGTLEENFFLKSVSFENSNKIPSYITDAVVGYDEETGENILFSDYIEEGSADSLGSNDYCAYLSGWMYTVNAPTTEALYLGMSQATVNDGDVIRVQFSLDCGADIGIANLSGMPEWGYHSDFYPVADKTKLTRAIACANASVPSPVYNAVQNMKEVAADLPATQQEVDSSLSDYNTLVSLNPLSGDIDLDGNIKLKDAILAQKGALQILEFSSVESLIADYNSDGVVNLLDAVLIQKASLGMAS